MVRIFLTIQGVFFAIFGLIAFFEPILLAEFLGVEVAGPHGSYELRGVYGGVSIGAASLLLTGAIRTTMVRPALYFLLAYTGGYFLARVVAICFDGMPEPYFFLFVVYEAVTALLALVFLLRASTK